MTTYCITRTVFRATALDLLDLEAGGGTVWGQTARDAADLIGGQNLPDPAGRPSPTQDEPEPDGLRIRAIVRIARACMAAFTSPYPCDDDVMRDVLGDVTAASLVGTPFAYYRQWWRPPAAAGVATTRKMTADEADRRAGLERALKAQRAQAAAEAEDRWKHVHEDVTMVRTADPAASDRPTQPWKAVRPPK